MQLIYEVRSAPSVCCARQGLLLACAGASWASVLLHLTQLHPTSSSVLTRLAPQARDLDIDAKPRSDAPSRFAFQKLTTAETKARATESLARIQGPLGSYISKSYWTQAFNEVRLDNLRYPAGPVL